MPAGAVQPRQKCLCEASSCQTSPRHVGLCSASAALSQELLNSDISECHAQHVGLAFCFWRLTCCQKHVTMHVTKCDRLSACVHAPAI